MWWRLQLGPPEPGDLRFGPIAAVNDRRFSGFFRVLRVLVGRFAGWWCVEGRRDTVSTPATCH